MGELRSEVDTLEREWCRVSNLTEYNEIKSRLDCIGRVLSCISNWVNWWHARRFHLFPVFRGFSLSSLNLAEIGHSTLKRNRPLFLVDAAWEDVCSMTIQEEEFTKFLEGRGKSMGRGPSTASQAAKDKRAQSKRAKEYVQSLRRITLPQGMGKMFSFQQRRLSTRHLIISVPATHFKLPFHQTVQVQVMLHFLQAFQVQEMLPFHQAV